MPVAAFKRHEVKLLAVFMVLLSLAAGWLLSSRPGHKIEGDFYLREQARQADQFLADQAVQHPIAAFRARACLSLGRIGGPEAEAALIAALRDPAASVRASAAFALGLAQDQNFHSASPPREVVDPLLASIGDEERLVAAHAVDALGRIGLRSAAVPLTQTAAPLIYTLTALVRLDARDLIPWSAGVLGSDDQDVRWAGLVALNAFEAPCAEGLQREFVRLSKDRNAFVRAEAARALHRCPAVREVMRALGKLARDDDPKIVFEAMSREEPPAQVPAIASASGDIVVFEERELQKIARIEGRRLTMRTTAGDFRISLDYDNAPLTAERFYRRAQAGAFNGAPLTVRPNGHVRFPGASPGRPETSPVPFLRGSLGIVRSNKDTDSGNVFIALTPLALADGLHTNFGRLLSGDDILDRLTANDRILSVDSGAN